MLQYKIPQNVGLEDKVVGPFSLRQLIIVSVGTGISYVIYLIMAGIYELNILEYLVIGLPALISLAAALIRINNISFTKYVMLMIEFSIKPKKRMWDHHGIASLVSPDLTESLSQKKQDEDKGPSRKKNVNLSDLSRVLDSGGFDHVETVSHDDIDQASDDNLMIQAFFGKDPNMYWRTAKSKVDYKRRLKLLSELPKTEVQAMKDLKEQITHLKQGDSVKRETVKQESIVIEPKTAVQEKPKTQAPKQTSKVEVKKSAPQTASAPAPSTPKVVQPATPPAKKMEVTPTAPQSDQNPNGEKKKRRRRRRKGKGTGPARNAQINNTIPGEPVKLIENEPKKAPENRPAPAPKSFPKKTEPKAETKTEEKPKAAKTPPANSGEIRFEELKKGDIEWGL